MAKIKTLMDIFNAVAQKKFGVAEQDIEGRHAHFEEIMSETMRIFNKRLRDRLRRCGFNSGADTSRESPDGGNNG